MQIIKQITRLIYGNHSIMYSRITSIFTKYGRYQVQAYRDEAQEHLAIMSQNFFDLTKPIVYIHADHHECDPHEEGSCYCNNQMDMALKMIAKEGGLIIYTSTDGKGIDGLLHEIKARKLETERNVMTKTKINLDLNATREYQSLGFILNNLNLSDIKLVTSDLRAVHVADQLGIDITKRTPAITFGYGG